MLSSISPKVKLVLAILMVVLLLGGLALTVSAANTKTPLYIAAVLPLTGDSSGTGTQMLNASRLYLDDINANGGINGQHVELLVYDNQADAALGYKMAQQIIAENKAIAVVGHMYSSDAIAAGPLYRDAHLVAITPSATDPKVTEGNEWLFRVLSNNPQEASYAAEYIKEVSQHDTASVIIVDDHGYGSSLGESFVKSFTQLGGKMQYTFTIGEDEDVKAAAARIADELSKPGAPDPGMIFMSTYSSFSSAFIIALKERHLNYPLMGDDDMGAADFPTSFDDQPLEKKHPGYYSDGVLAVAPFIADVGGERAQTFRTQYAERFGAPPNVWTAATQYDAMLVAVEAMKGAQISGKPADLVADRQTVRDYIASQNSLDQSFDGITGRLYFDGSGNVVKPMVMGMFQNNHFVSADKQIQPVTNLDSITHLDDALNDHSILKLGDSYMYRTQVVYTGISINEISRIDVEVGQTYEMNFYLWFRYQGDFDPKEIVFFGERDPIELGEPVDQSTFGNTKYVVYRIEAVFHNDFNLADYPFDQQKIAIRFRPRLQRQENLIFVVDTLGIRGSNTSQDILSNLQKESVLSSVANWRAVDAQFFTDSTTSYSTLGNPNLFNNSDDIQYSRFNAVITVKRNAGLFVIKNMLPVMMVLLVAYLGLFLPNHSFELLNTVFTTSLLAIIFFHVGLSGQLRVGYIVAMDFAFLGLYILLVIELVLGLITWHYHENQQLIRRLRLVGRIIYPTFLLVGAVTMLIVYHAIGS